MTAYGKERTLSIPCNVCFCEDTQFRPYGIAPQGKILHIKHFFIFSYRWGRTCGQIYRTICRRALRMYGCAASLYRRAGSLYRRRTEPENKCYNRRKHKQGNRQSRHSPAMTIKNKGRTANGGTSCMYMSCTGKGNLPSAPVYVSLGMI